MAYIGANPQTSLQQYLTIDDISGSFNGVLTSFALQVGGVAPVPGPSQSNQLLISLGGVIQEPDDTGSAGFRLSGGNIIFSSAPASSTAFFGVVLAGADYIYAGTNFPDGSVTTPSITFANDLDSGFYRAGSGELAYTSNGTFRLKIDSSGRLGVGTSSPGDKLSVSTGNVGIYNTGTAHGNVYFYKDGTAKAWVKYRGDDDTFRLGNNTSDALTITSSGNVGVGTTSPSALLHVAGANSAGMAIFEDTAGTNKIGKIFGYAGGLYLQSRNDTNYGEIVFRAENSGGTAERMRIDSSGRVGIGTSSPAQLLHLQSSDPILQITRTASHVARISAPSGGGIAFGADGSDGSTVLMRINSAGNVGIGTTSPSSALQVNGIIRAQRSDDSNPRYTQISFEGGISSLDSVRNDSQFEAIRFRQSADNGSNYTERMRIDSSGQVGIGTTSTAVGRVGILANTNAEALSLISRPSDDQCELHFRNSADDATLARISTSGGQNFAVRTGASEAFRVDSSQRLLVGHSSSQGSGTRLEVNSNTSGVANVAIVKRNSGTANQHGQNLDFYNFGPSATARADGTEIGAVRFYASQPTSGAAQLGAGIYCSADGTQSGNSVPSKLSFYTSSGTSVPERIRIKADGAVSLGDWHTSSGYHRINRKVAQGGEILIISAYDTANTDTARFFSINTGAYNTNNAALHIGRDSATSRSINAGGTVNASGADYAEYMTKAGDFSLAKGDVCGVNADGKLTNVFAEAISFVVKSTDPSYVGGDTWGTEEAIGKKPDAEDADALAEWEANLEAARQTVDRIAFAGQVPVNVTGATAGQYIIPLQAADGSIEGSAKNEADLTLSEYMQAVGKVIAIEDDGRARIIVKVA